MSSLAKRKTSFTQRPLFFEMFSPQGGLGSEEYVSINLPTEVLEEIEQQADEPREDVYELDRMINEELGSKPLPYWSGLNLDLGSDRPLERRRRMREQLSQLSERHAL